MTTITCQLVLDYGQVAANAIEFYDNELVTDNTTIIWDWGLVSQGLCINTELDGIAIDVDTGEFGFGDLVNIRLDGIEICVGTGNPFITAKDAQVWNTIIDPNQTWTIQSDDEQTWRINNKKCGV